MYIYAELQKKYDDMYKKNHELIKTNKVAETYFERMRRVLSWLKRADQETCDNDPTAHFIFLWIAFNACYGKHEDYVSQNRNDLQNMLAFFSQLGTNSKNRLLKLVTENSDDAENNVRKLLYNPYIDKRFWKAYEKNPKTAKESTDRYLESDNKDFFAKIKDKQIDIEDILGKIFSCIYFHRNQLMHGSATWRTTDEEDFRVQTKNCCAIMAKLMPIFVNAMLEHIDKEKWGGTIYPVMPAPYK